MLMVVWSIHLDFLESDIDDRGITLNAVPISIEATGGGGPHGIGKFIALAKGTDRDPILDDDRAVQNMTSVPF